MPTEQKLTNEEILSLAGTRDTRATLHAIFDLTAAIRELAVIPELAGVAELVGDVTGTPSTEDSDGEFGGGGGQPKKPGG